MINETLNMLSSFHKKDISEYMKKVKEETYKLRTIKGGKTTLGAGLNSPLNIFYTDDNYNNSEYIIFDGESLNAEWDFNMNRFVFQGKKKGSDNYNIYLYDINTNTYAQLTHDNGNNKDPTFSPICLKILFSSDRKGTYNLYTMNLDGSNQEIILEDESYDLCLPSYSPNGNWIGYSTASEEGWDLWVMKNDSLIRKVHVSDGVWGYCRIKWNPLNNGEVVYVKDRRKTKNKERDQSDLVIGKLYIDEDKTPRINEIINLTELSLRDYPDSGSDNFPDWSIDGKYIIFSYTPGYRTTPTTSDWILKIIKRDGKGRRNFAYKVIKAKSPDWIS